MTHPLVSIRQELTQATPVTHVDSYKKEIIDLFRDYRHPWDVFTELLQNSVDAINQNAAISEGQIEIEINQQQRLIRIRDNGNGVKAENLRKILVPNVSIDKGAKTTYGYKGVGLSFVAHLTNKITVTSRRDGVVATYSLSNNFPWIIGRTAEEIHEEEPKPAASSGNPYTEITLILDGAYSDSGLRTLQGLDYFFDWASDAKVVEFIFRTRTALGNSKTYLGQSPAKPIQVSLIINGTTTALPYRLLTPFDAAYTRTSRYFLEQKFDGKERYMDVYLDSKRADHLKVFKCLRHDIFSQEVGVRVKTTFDVSILCCGETAVSKLQEEFNVTKDCAIYDSLDLGTGIFLAINGMPTGIKLHQWTDGFNKRFFCLVDVDMETNAELDKGRKGISEHTKKLIIIQVEQLLSDKIINGRYSIRNAGHKMSEPQSRGYAGTDFKMHLDKWDAKPAVTKSLSIPKAPLDENGVIGMFFELIGKGLLVGYQIRYISQDAAYDFGFSYIVEKARLGSTSLGLTQAFVDALGYDLEKNDWQLKNSLGDTWHVGEFKLAVEDIVNREAQPLKNLDLLVTWDFDQAVVDKRGGTIVVCPDDQRPFEGVTHILNDNSGDCYVIVLRELLLGASMLI